jgi:gluconolactonase
MAWSHDGHLYFSDGPGGRIHRWTPGEPIALLPARLKGPAGLAVDEHGRLLVCEAGARRIVRIGTDDAIGILAAAFEGRPLNSPDDLVIRRDGTIFFTDPAFGSAADAMALPFHGLYRLNAKGEAVALARWSTRPNGVALSPDGKTLYVAMSDERAVRAFDLDRQGNVSNERILIGGIAGVPGALRTDGKGRLFLAAHVVRIYSPEGKPLGQIEITERPTSLAFGEAGGRTLFIAAHTSIYRVEFGESR